MPSVPWTPHAVYAKDTLHDALWDEQANLVCLELTRGLSPTLDQATLLYQFGHIDGAYVPRLALAGKYILIDVPGINMALYGYVISETLDRGPQEDAGNGVQRLRYGDQSFRAVGLEWFLQRQTVNHSIIYPTTRIDRVIGFNTGFGENRDIGYADRGNKDTRGLAFAEDKDHAEPWSATDIADYLLANFSPRDKDGNLEPAIYELDAGAAPYLDGFDPVLPVRSQSVWQLLNAVAAPNRGLTTWVEYVSAVNTVRIHVSSQAPAAVALPGGGTLPAAAVQIALPNLDGGQWRVRLSNRIDRHLDRVVCRGALRRSVFTPSFAASTLEPSWRATDETSYKAAAGDPDPKVNDRFRQSNRFERVYQCYQIPTTWNGEVAPGVKACPAFIQGSGSIVGGEKLHLASLRLVQPLPIRVGWDYADATNPTPRDPDNIRSEFQQPFAMVDVGGGAWRFVHEINVNDEGDGQERLTTYGFHILQGTPGIQLRPGAGMPHAIALNHIGPGGADATSDHNPEVDYETLRATVCAEWDAYCEGYWPVAEPTTDPLQTLYVYIDERARFDWLAVGTIYDVEGGVLKTTTTAGALRDDRNLCADVARLAFEWYSMTRQEMQLTAATIEAPADVGDLITTIGTDAAEETINAVVSQISYNLRDGTTAISVGFAELNVASL